MLNERAVTDLGRRRDEAEGVHAVDEGMARVRLDGDRSDDEDDEAEAEAKEAIDDLRTRKACFAIILVVACKQSESEP